MGHAEGSTSLLHLLARSCAQCCRSCSASACLLWNFLLWYHLQVDIFVLHKSLTLPWNRLVQAVYKM